MAVAPNPPLWEPARVQPAGHGTCRQPQLCCDRQLGFTATGTLDGRHVTLVEGLAATEASGFDPTSARSEPRGGVKAGLQLQLANVFLPAAERLLARR